MTDIAPTAETVVDETGRVVDLSKLPGVRTCDVCGRKGPGLLCYRKPWAQGKLKYAPRAYFHLKCFNAEKARHD